MALSIGIAGLPNVGKSTLFNALTKSQIAQAANYPFCTIEPNKATVAVPDKRVTALAKKVSPRKTTNATVDFIDIAGLVKGASKGEGLGNQFLGNIRECSAILHVIRCFDDENITHVDNSIDPVRDAETVETEFLLADLQTIEKRLEKLSKMAKAGKDAKLLKEFVEQLHNHLDSGKPASTFPMPDNDQFKSLWKEMGLLTAKPVIYCANVNDATINDNAYANSLKKYAEDRGSAFTIVCAQLEEELVDLEEEEQKELLQSYQLHSSGLEKVIQQGYKLLGLASYFTAGPDEVRAWTIHDGWKAPKAAGVIHTDFEKGFIRAEVIDYENYMRYENEAACRAAGVLRTEGKDYIVKDGDVMHFLFNV